MKHILFVLMKMTDIPRACHLEESLAALQTTYTAIIQPQLKCSYLWGGV